MREIGHADSRRRLQLMEHPELRTGDPASLFDLAKVVTNGPVNQPELLQYVECQLLMSRLVALIGYQFLALRHGLQVSLPHKVQL